MRCSLRSALLASTLFATACTGVADPSTSPQSEAPVWSYQTWNAELRAESCPEGTAFAGADPLDIRVIQTERGTEDDRNAQLDGLVLAGAWALESTNSEFGGLSGLDQLSPETLLAVTDDGKFVWIGIDPQTSEPDGSGSIAYMRDLEGKIFPTKRAADAEDLAVRDGLAFVSFEQDHRIFAYDLAACGKAARAAMVVKLDKVIDKRTLENNRGAEALDLSGDVLKVGFETRRGTGSPIGTVLVDGRLANLGYTEQPTLFLLTGMDSASDLSAAVFRAYDPVRGSRANVTITRDGAPIASAKLRSPLPVDNFESIAIGTGPNGATRIWLLSDDNFSNDQRTLLLALDLIE